MTGQMELDFSGVEQAEANADGWWWSCAMAALEQLASTGLDFTAYDITELGVPEADHSARWGALFSSARKAGTIHAVGYVQSRRPGRSGGACRLWRGSGVHS